MVRCIEIILLVIMTLAVYTEGFWLIKRRRSCSKQNCRVDNWTSWTTCSATCGIFGSQSRSRRKLTTESCGGICWATYESRVCNNKCCPVDCIYKYGDWGPCKGVCGQGIQESHRIVLSSEKCGGQCKGDTVKTRTCDTQKCCPVNCMTGSWGSWGSCNAACEKNGKQTRTRAITRNPTCNGNTCGSLTMDKPCAGPCCPKDCVFSTWTPWRKCNAPVGVCSSNSGTQTRSRTVIKVAYCNGRCGSTSASQQCTPQSISCQLSSWGSWSLCTASNGVCGTGTRTRTRNIQIQPVCSANCASLTDTSSCLHSCCPKNCEYNQWGQWGNCTNQCGKGMQQRTRTVKAQHSCGGVQCSFNQLKTTRTCTVYSNVDCKVSSWSTWSACSNGCGSGTSTRTRSVTRPKKCNGKSCASLLETKACQSYRNNRDCVVNQWSSYGACSEKCAVGVRYRHRNITSHVVCNGGQCPALTSTMACGQANGGCDHNCNSAVCSCRPGYDLVSSTACRAKDCGSPSLSYCPPSLRFCPTGFTCLGNPGGACIYPTINCPSSQTIYPTQCPLICPTGYTLVGETRLSCQTTGRWKTIQSYCKRDNEPPTNIIISGDLSIPENAISPFDIGQITTIDANTNDSHTYTIKRDDCNCFSIVGNTLKALRAFDFEAQKNTFQIDVETIDNGIPHLSFRKTFTITITDVNEKPTDIIFSNGFVDENTNGGVVVGTLQTVDADHNQTYTYDIVGGNLLFKIQGNQIITAQSNKDCLTANKPNMCPINYEKDQLITLMVNTKDSGNPSMDVNQRLTVIVRDINDVPYNVTLSSADVNENAGVNTYIGTFATKEEDKGQVLSYTLIDNDNGNFYVDSTTGRLYKSKPSDYESTYAHLIVVEVKDNGTPQKSVQQNFTINVIDVNEPPVNVTLKNVLSRMENKTLFLPENTTINTMLATILVYDRDSINTVQIGLDDSYNDAFTIQTSTMKCSPILGNKEARSVCSATFHLSKELNYEQKTSYDLKFRIVDRGHSALHHFYLEVTDCNDAPSEVRIQNNKQIDVMENQQGIDVGTLSTDDEDLNQIYTYELLNEQSIFEIIGNLLKLKDTIFLDYETRTSYDLTIRSTDNGIPEKSVKRHITVNVVNINDPVSSVMLSTYKVLENQQNTLVANITIIDEDIPSPSAKTHQCQTQQPSPFYVTDNQIYVGKSLDYESKPVINMTLKCQDQSLTSTWSFEMQVVDVNEPPTAIHFSASNISENSIPPFHIGNFSCVDPEDDDCTYQLRNNRWTDVMEVRGRALYGTSHFDYERESVLDINIETTDSGTPPLSFVGKLLLSVVDCNEVPLDITLSNNVIDENSLQYTVVGYLETIEEDRGQTHSYQLFDDSQGRFEIYNKTLRVSKVSDQCVQHGGEYCTLNFEKSSGHQVTVMTTDNGVPPLTLSKNFTVYLRDVNDAPRDITLSNYKVYENAAVNSLIGIFNATDEDFGQTLTFKLIGGHSDHFYIDGQSQLRVKTNFSDYETQTTYKLLVLVEDNGARKLQTSNYVTVEVLNVNETPIKIEVTDENASQRFNQSNPHVAENTKLGTVVGTMYSHDADFASRLVFSVDDDSNGTFTLSNKTSCSNVTFANIKTTCKTQLLVGKEINYEQKVSHRILVRVTDQGGLFHVQEVTVVIIDQDDRSTDLVINNYNSVSIKEGQQNSAYIIGHLRTIDEDAGQTFRYELADVNMTQIFDIQNEYLMVKANAVLDFESIAKYTLSIHVFDGTSNSLALTDSINVEITDVNEAPQAIQVNRLNVPENSLPGTVVSNISVIDPDNFGANKVKQTHNCTVMNSPYFEVSSDNFLITGQENIDYEQKPKMIVEILCSDSGSPSLTVTDTFTIHAQDINEKPINISLSSKHVIENAAPGTIGDLSTDDHDNFDGLIQQTFVYELLNKSVPFTIKNHTLFTTSSLDYETQDSYVLNIRSTDDGKPHLSTESLIQVSVIDMNEPASGILLSSSNIVENAMKGTKIGDLTAVDEDRSSTGQRQQHTFELLQNPKGIFRIAGECLEVAINCNTQLCKIYGGVHCLLNFEENGYQTVRIKVTDDGTPSQSYEESFNIRVVNINEPPRGIQLSKRTVPENATIGYVIGHVTYTDEDYSDNHTVYLIDDDQGRFQINENRELVKMKSTNYEKQSIHHITIGVKDNGKPPMNATFDVNIYVEDINESPTSLHITDRHAANSFLMDRTRIDENLPVGSTVGTIEALDQDTVTDLIFSLVDDADGRFRLDGNVTCQNVTQNQSLHTSCETKLLTNKMLNYEENNVLVVLVKVADHANLSHVAQFNISLMDKNDAPTNVTVSGETSIFVLENRQDVEIGKLETVDEDAEQTHTYQLIDDAGQRFSIKPGTVDGYALYTTSVNINYEESDNYNVIVMTTDNGNPPMSYRHSISIQVIDQNERPTDIVLNPYKVEENAADSIYIGNITVNDPDNERYPGKQTHSCSIIQHPSPYDTPFKLKNNKLYTMNCTSCAKFDYERTRTLPVYVRCDDSGYPSLTFVKRLSVDILDVNEPPTGLTLSNNRVPENIKGIYIGSFTGVDPDRTPNQNLTYKLLDGTALFSLHGEKLLTSIELDYEKNQSHIIQVKVSDYEGLYYTESFTLLVQDQNDVPTDLTCTGVFSIPETSLPGTTVGTCTAVDEDTSQTHHYELLRLLAVGYNETKLFSNPNQIFKIESSTGRIEQVTKSLNHEQYMEYILIIQSTDSGSPPLSIKKNVTVAITNVNQPPTDIIIDSEKIAENSPIGSLVGQLSIVDPDNQHKNVHGFTCSVKNLDGSKCAFIVDKTNRMVVKEVYLVDFEYMPFYDVNVSCTEDTSNKYSISKTFTIQIINVNEAPTNISLKPNDINEHNQAGSIVGTITFVDPDNLIGNIDQVTISTFNTFGAPFAISAPYTVTATQRLDYETAAEYVVQVTLEDNGTPVQKTTKNLTIKVNDRNDYPYNITLSTLLLPENLKPGDKVATLTTLDHDKGQTHTYQLLNDGGIFKVSNADLILTSKVQHKITKTVDVFVQTTDNGTPPLSAQEGFTITIVDKNDQPTDVLFTVSPISENTKDKVKVADLKVVDDDIGQSHTCTSLGVDFVECVTENSGNVSVYILGNKKSTDYETNPSFSINLRCTDNGSPNLSIDKTLTIPVSDVNESPTGVTINNNLAGVGIPENTQPGYIIGNLGCVDPDNYHVCTFTLLGNSTDFFTIVGDELQVKNLSLNYEAPPGLKSTFVYIKATDQGGLSYGAAIKVTSTDVNEPPYNIRFLEGDVAVPENKSLNTNFAQLLADDPERDNQKITFKLLNLNDVLEIVEVQSRSYLQLKQELDYDKKTLYSVSVQASDNGTPMSTTSVTVDFSVLRSDRCVTHSIVCQQNASCIRISKTKVECTCDKGFRTSENNKCAQINECEESCDNCLDIDRQNECKSGRAPLCGKCFHKGTCHDHHLNFTCSCIPGFTGHQCYTNINDCVNKPCVNGACVDGINSFKCNCYKGYTGEHCAEQINECTQVKQPCYNGECVDLEDSYKCTCPDEYSGVYCERKLCSTSTQCKENQFCHSVNLIRGEGNTRCIPNDKLVSLLFDTSFAPLSGDKMFEWKFKFIRFLSNEVKIPYSWLIQESSGVAKDISLDDVAIYEYDDHSVSRSRRSAQVETTTNNVTRVSFYSIWSETVVKPNVLLYAINDTCDQYYTCGQTHTDFDIKNNAFECGVCKVVNDFINTKANNENFFRPVVLSSIGDPDDPLWMDVLPIVGIVLSGILLLVIGVCIYRRRRNDYRFKQDRLETEKKICRGTTLSVMADRSRTWTENDLAHYSGQINPMYGLDEEEVESPVVGEIRYREINPEWSTVFSNEQQQPSASASSGMFENPLYGISSGDLSIDDEKDTEEVPEHRDHSEGFFNPTFFSDNPESEF